MTHTTKKDLTTQLRPLSKATLKLLAIEVGCVVYRAGAATHDVSAPQLADFLIRFPLPARRPVHLLRTTSKDAIHHALADCIEGVRGCGPLTVGRWHLTPGASGVQCVSETKRCYVCYSTDLRVGVIVLDTPQASTAVPLAFAGLPKGVNEALTLLLGPPPEAAVPRRKTR